jgi:hypothetical protein
MHTATSVSTQSPLPRLAGIVRAVAGKQKDKGKPEPGGAQTPQGQRLILPDEALSLAGDSQVAKLQDAATALIREHLGKITGLVLAAFAGAILGLALYVGQTGRDVSKLEGTVAGLDRRVDSLDRRFTEQTGAVNQQFNTVNARLDGIQRQLIEMERGLNHVRQAVGLPSEDAGHPEAGAVTRPAADPISHPIAEMRRTFRHGQAGVEFRTHDGWQSFVLLPDGGLAPERARDAASTKPRG